MVLLTAIGLGILISIPPGPASSLLMAAARNGERSRWFKLLAQVLAADLIIMSLQRTILLPFAHFFETFLMKAAAGIFLMALGILSFKAHRKAHVPRRSGSLFWLTLFNPAVWCGMMLIVSWSLSGGWTFLLGFQLGTALWYVILAVLFMKLSLKVQNRILLSSFVFITILGLATVAQAFTRI